jgi:hypothetical protein
MAAGTSPIFVTTPKSAQCRIATANTGRDGSGTLGTVHTAGASGAFFRGVRVQAEGTVTAGVVRIFLQKGGSGNFELIKEVMITATTPSTSVEAFSSEWLPTAGLVLGASDVLCASTNNAETFSVSAVGGGDY